jgi:hypothetical protein
MQKTNCLLLLVPGLWLVACKKNTEKANTFTDSTMRYEINDMPQLPAMVWHDSFKCVLSLLHTGGKKEMLTLSVDNLPPNTEVVFSKPAAVPPFST